MRNVQHDIDSLKSALQIVAAEHPLSSGSTLDGMAKRLEEYQLFLQDVNMEVTPVINSFLAKESNESNRDELLSILKAFTQEFVVKFFKGEI